MQSFKRFCATTAGYVGFDDFHRVRHSDKALILCHRGTPLPAIRFYGPTEAFNKKSFSLQDFEHLN
jgi:hypothetical protein